MSKNESQHETADATLKQAPSDLSGVSPAPLPATTLGAGRLSVALGIAGTIQLPPARPVHTLDSGARLDGGPEVDGSLSSVPFQPTLQASASQPSSAAGGPSFLSFPSLPADSSAYWQGRLVAGDEIGRGGMGAVLKGVDADLRRELAIKVVGTGVEASASELVRFVEEAQVTAQLEHPNVVPVHELGVDPQGRAFFTMKLVRGESLEAILRKRSAKDPSTVAQWGLRRLLDVFLNVCQAIEYAHARGVIHRDLKPANIMVGDFGEVLVMDWGVAKVKGRMSLPQANPVDAPQEVSTVRSDGTAHQTMSGTVLGTPAYMSPEQARGDLGLVDERTDIYALGAILYELLCGRPPFEGNTPLAVLSQVLTVRPARPSQIARGSRIPPALEDLALRMLEKDPAARCVSISQARSHIQDWIEGIGDVWRPETLATKLSWGVGALGLFLFLVWYLTGRTIAGMLYPHHVLNAAGWFFVVMAVGYPLWAFGRAFRVSRRLPDRFRRAHTDQLFASGFYAYRRLALAIAPIFQLALFAELLLLIVPGVLARRAPSAVMLQQLIDRLRGDSYHALIIPLVFLFLYLFFQAEETRFARSIERFEPLLRRSVWELAWPLCLIVTLVSVMIGMDAVSWGLARGAADPLGYLRDRVLLPQVDVLLLVKTLVFQGTFLGVLLAFSLLVLFPFPELLAALRIRYQPGDEAYVRARRHYFLRSLAVFHVARANALYVGAMIGCLTTMTAIADDASSPVVARAVLVLAPCLLGLVAFGATTSYLRSLLTASPAIRDLLTARINASRGDELRALRKALDATPWSLRLTQLAFPLACGVIYLLWVSGGRRDDALDELVRPATTKDVITAVPFLLLVPGVLVRDSIHSRWLRFRPAGRPGEPSPPRASAHP